MQFIGVAAVGVFAFGSSWLLWRVFALTLGVRVSANVERLGQDTAELKLEAYPEFILMPEQDDEED